ncbi:hypothetical protein B0H13DRAFT_2547955 [Mycena leptocephala]|nr:hypothetical protein B0H13DRAFT_2547955 [Mycena leptocephala]
MHPALVAFDTKAARAAQPSLSAPAQHTVLVLHTHIPIIPIQHGLGPENVKAPPHASRGGEREREQSGRAKTRTLGRVSASRAVASGQHLIGNAPAGIPPVAGTLRSAHRFSPACLIHTHTHTAHHLLAIHTAQPSSCPSAQSFTFTSTYRAPARDWRKRQSQQRGREQRGKIGASTRTSPLASPGTPYRTSAAAKRGEKHCSSPLKVSPRSALFTSSDLPGMLRRKSHARKTQEVRACFHLLHPLYTH